MARHAHWCQLTSQIFKIVHSYRCSAVWMIFNKSLFKLKYVPFQKTGRLGKKTKNSHEKIYGFQVNAVILGLQNKLLNNERIYYQSHLLRSYNVISKWLISGSWASYCKIEYPFAHEQKSPDPTYDHPHLNRWSQVVAQVSDFYERLLKINCTVSKSIQMEVAGRFKENISKIWGPLEHLPCSVRISSPAEILSFFEDDHNRYIGHAVEIWFTLWTNIDPIFFFFNF